MPILTAKNQPLRLSASKIKDALLCMRLFKLAHIDLLAKPKPSKYLTFGTTMHDVFELAHLRDKPPTKREMKGWLNKFWIKKDEEYNALLNGLEYWEALGYESIKEEVEFKELGIKIIDDYHASVIKAGEYKPSLHTEIYFKLPFSKGYELSGKIDRIVETDEGKLQIVDWKTSQKKDSINALMKDVQLGIYWWASKELFNINDDDIEDTGLYYLRHSEYRAIKHDIFSLGGVLGQIEEVIDKVENEYFVPTKSWKCNYCDVKDACDAINNNKAKCLPIKRG